VNVQQNDVAFTGRRCEISAWPAYPLSYWPYRTPRPVFASTLKLTLTAGDRIRLLAGRPHPTDPARFTIPYTLNGLPGTIEGRLASPDHVTFHLTGPATSRPCD